MKSDQKVSRLRSFCTLCHTAMGIFWAHMGKVLWMFVILLMQTYCKKCICCSVQTCSCCPHSARPQCSHSIRRNHHTWRVAFVLCITFLMSKGKEQRTWIQYCTKLEEKKRTKTYVMIKTVFPVRLKFVYKLLSGSTALKIGDIHRNWQTFWTTFSEYKWKSNNQSIWLGEIRSKAIRKIGFLKKKKKYEFLWSHARQF